VSYKNRRKLLKDNHLSQIEEVMARKWLKCSPNRTGDPVLETDHLRGEQT
jgi:hypothetical protein